MFYTGVHLPAMFYTGVHLPAFSLIVVEHHSKFLSFKRIFPPTNPWATSTIMFYVCRPDSLRRLNTIHRHQCHFLFQHKGRSMVPWLSIPHPKGIDPPYLRGIVGKNIGNWAQLLLEHIQFRPLHSHPFLKMVRRLSHVHHYRVLVTPSHNVVYIVFHIYLHIAHVGITTMAVASRPRQHTTNALSTQECSNLHSKMCITNLSHWGRQLAC